MNAESTDNSEEELTIMEIIANGGDARTKAIQAIQSAKNGDYEHAREALKGCKQSLNKAHVVQTEMIQKEIRGEGGKTSLLMVHAQDHLMNAITVKDLAIELVDILEKGALVHAEN